MVRLSALRTGRLYSPGNIPGTNFCYRLSRPQGHSAAGRIVSMKNSKDTIGNRTRDLPTCSAVPQPTALLRASPLCCIPWLNLMAALKPFKPTANRDFCVPTDDTSLPACDAVSVEWFWRFKTTQCYDMIYLLTAIGWSRGGSTHLHTNNTENNTNKNRTKHITTNVEERGPCPVFASFTLAFALQLRKKTEKPQPG